MNFNCVKNKLLKAVLQTLGSFFLIIGALLFPLPFIPFILFTIGTYCFAKSSPIIYLKITSNPYFGSAIKNFIERRELSAKYKLFSIVSLNVSLLFASFFLIIDQPLNYFLFITGVACTAIIILIKNPKGEIKERATEEI